MACQCSLNVNVALSKELMSLSERLLLFMFFQRYVENSNVGACMNELIQLEHGEVLSQQKLRMCSALFTALDSVSDSVEISNEDHEIQV